MHMLKKLIFCVLLLVFQAPLWAQLTGKSTNSEKNKHLSSNGYSQTIRGKVIDQFTGLPLIGATIQLFPSDSLRQAITDTNGQFLLEGVKLGRYSLKVRFIGYEEYIVPELLITKGKQVIQDIAMQVNPYDLETVTIAASSVNSLASGFLPTITVEKIRRFPATFFDPARLMAAYPGVVNTNDQANNLSIRGNTPNGVLWRLEGVDIVNPNHLSNAGTVDDRPTQNGGGVNILSAQMLHHSHLLIGALPADYGNAQSGVFDMKLKDGNNQHSEFTSQIGLIGIDFAAEGPLGKSKNSSYLANYRFSTLGLLSALGVDLGDEAITFQDFSFKVAIPTQKSGKFSLFGFGGLSSNVFEAQRDSTVWEFEKDRQDIQFNSKVGAIGATYSSYLSDKIRLQLSSIYSIADHERSADILKGHNYSTSVLEMDKQQLGLWSSKVILDYAVNAKHQFNITTLLNQYDFRFTSNEGTFSEAPQEKIKADGQLQTMQTSLQWQANLAPMVSFNAGVNLHALLGVDFNRSPSVEPRFALKWQTSSKSDLTLAYGQHSQLQLFGTYFSTITDEIGNSSQPNQGLDFTKSRNYSLTYSQQLSNTHTVRLIPYYQDLYNVPISQKVNSFSVLNLSHGFVEEALVNEGTGKNYGVEASLEKYFSEDWYYLIGGTWYQSKYTGSDGIERNTRFNGNYNFNLTTGKEFAWHRKNKNRVLSVNAAFTYAGGFRDTPIDLAASNIAEQTIYKENEAFSLQMKDYYKLDLRIAIRRNKANSARIFALDIQNITNHRNIAYQYFDVQKSEVVTQLQLGIIPILSWRVEF